MPFTVIDNKKGTFTPRRKAEYLKLTQGAHIIRILNADAYNYQSHWVNNTNIACIGDGCPICENNRRILIETADKKDLQNHKDWRPVRTAYMLNVLDRTPVKTCSNPECKEEIKKTGADFPVRCPKCNTFVAETSVAHPLNKVRILSTGKELVERFNAVESANLDANGNVIPMNTHDWVIIVSGEGRDRKPTPIPQLVRNDVVEVLPEELFNLEDFVFRFSRDEILSLLRGTSIRDILIGRGNAERKTEEATSKLETVVNTISKTTQLAIEDLFKD